MNTWSLTNPSHRRGILEIRATDGKLIVETGIHNREHARLIAAAPEMLAALMETRELLLAEAKHTGLSDGANIALANTCAAIAKAEAN